jgi:hypothetical protein
MITWKCEYCNLVNDWNDKTCQTCGSSRSDPDIYVTVYERPKPIVYKPLNRAKSSRTVGDWTGIIGSFIVIGGCAIIYLLNVIR